MTGFFRFKGEDKFLITGAVYVLEVDNGSGHGRLIARISNLSTRPSGLLDRTQWWQCPYDSYELFAENWERV